MLLLLKQRSQLQQKFVPIFMACFSLLVLALCYQWIYAVQECSEYTLMITCLFVSIYFFCRYTETQGIKDEVFFILGCVGAMYSQYGAVFIVGPILMISLVYTLSRKNRIISIRSLLLYGISFVVFAIPLYFRYLRTQMINNKIIEYAVKQFGIAEFKRLFGQFGLNIGYLWNLNLTILSKYIMVLVGIVFMLYLIITLIKNRANWKAWDMLILTLIIGYLVHYFLVIFHIYAMIHPDMSSGFYCRYSWFYIPAFAVIIPGSLYLLYSTVKPGRIRQAAAVGFTIGMIIGLFPNIAKNWHKAYDDVFAEQWMERGGYQEPTYLCGAYYWEGFDTYVTKKYGESYKSQVYELSDLDPNQLPPVFWVWRTNWGGDVADELSVTAVAKGYHEEMVNGPAPLWQLIRYSI